jgi:hypothetical protein
MIPVIMVVMFMFPMFMMFMPVSPVMPPVMGVIGFHQDGRRVVNGSGSHIDRSRLADVQFNIQATRVGGSAGKQIGSYCADA